MTAVDNKTGVQQQRVFPITPQWLRERVLNPKDPMCPFYNYEGNDDAKKTAISLAKKSFNSELDIGLAAGEWHEPVWACNRKYPVRMLLTGPRSVGKTTFGKSFGAIVSIDWDNCQQVVGPEHEQWKMPWVEIDGTGVRKREEILAAMMSACKGKDVPLVPNRIVGGVRTFIAPPMVLFIDEVHGLPKPLMEGLLKMTEPNDGIFEVGVQTKVDCRAITVIAATTNPGALKDTFLSRFPVALELKQHTPDQVANMIRKQFQWPKAEALQLAMLKPLPREAMAVAKLVQDTKNDEGITLKAAIKQWTGNLGLREGGLSDKAREVLLSLAESQPHGLSRDNLCAQMAIGKDEFIKQIIPQLLRTAYHPAYIVIASRHKITEAGLKALNRENA